MPTRRVLRRSLIGAAAVLAVLLVVATATGVATVRRPFPTTEGQIGLPGLDGEVAVQRDARGVPQIYAESTDDLFRAQGYVHAQDRFFEMDWRRHVTAGRVSELVGANDDALRLDKIVRTLGWRRVASAELELATPATRRHLEAYARGVNDYLRGRSAAELSLSYPLLGLGHPMPAIEPWTPVDSIAWLKALAWDLRSDDLDEAGRALAYGVVRDVARVDQLYPAYPYGRHAPIITSGSASTRSLAPVSPAAALADSAVTSAPAPTRVPPSAERSAGSMADVLAGPAQDALARAHAVLAGLPSASGGDGIGSNSWVASGALTASGKPLLANDPHLEPSLPGTWYQVGLHCRTVSAACPFDVGGFSMSGLPGVVIGHNGRIAWGLTDLGADVADLYLEKVTGDRVERDGAQVPLATRTETITIADAPAVTLTVRTGPHGPLLSDVLPELSTVGQRVPSVRTSPARGEGYAVAMSWTALTPGRAMDALLAMDAATDVARFRTAAQLLDVPAQNVVYADVDGHIGYQAAGRIPIRPSDDLPGQIRDGGTRETVPTNGTWPLPGWVSTHDWKGYVAAADLPSVLDPREGFIVAANQAVTAPGSSVTITHTYDAGYRSQRIRELLSARTRGGAKLTTADMEAIQADTHNGLAADLVPLLLAAKVGDPFYAQAVRLLRGWDGNQPVDSAAAAFFNAVWASLLELTFSDELPEGSRPDGGGRWFEVVRTLLTDPNDPWWDDRKTSSVLETRDEIVRQAIIAARNRLTRNLGKDPTSWTWGRLHRLVLTAAPAGYSDRTAVLHPLLNEGPVELPGGTSIVNALGWDAAAGDFDVIWAPSMRMVVDLGALDESRWVNSTGQSGHPGQAHYTDQLEAWASGRTFAWPFTVDAVQAATDQRLTFRSL